MTAVAAPTSADVREPTWRRVGGLALVAGVPLAVFAAGILLPYYGNDLDALPLEELASGRHDPKELWPSSTWWGGLLRLAGILAWGLAPLFLVLTGLAAAATAVHAWVTGPRRHRSPARVAVLVVLAVACLWGSTWFLGPEAGALWTWTMD